MDIFKWENLNVTVVPKIFNKLHQGSDGCSRGVACVDNTLSLCQFLLQVSEGLLIGPSEPSGLNLMGTFCQCLGAHCQVLVTKQKFESDSA